MTTNGPADLVEHARARRSAAMAAQAREETEPRPTDPEPFHVRQGDVLVAVVPSIPDDARPVAREGGRVVLAHGEVTGHAHAIRSRGATLLERGGERFLRISEAVTIDHEEHARIELPPGSYRVVIQREYVPPDVSPATWRRVVD